MPIIINKQNTGVAFRLPTKKVVIEGNYVLNNISDSDWAYIYTKWRKFIDDNIFSDKNPKGFFVLQHKEENAKAQSKELEVNDAIDAGKQMSLAEAIEVEFADMTAKQLKAYAVENEIAVSGNKKSMLEAIVKAEVAKRG